MSETIKKTVNNEEVKPKLTEKKLAIIITASVLALAVLTLTIVLTVSAIVNDSGFDYLKSDLSKYVEFSEDYKNFEVNVDIAKPRDIDVDVTILNMICEDKDEKALYEGNYVTSAITITPGDVVLIWYRGYIFDENGDPVEVDGMSNFTGSSPAELEIGGNGFVPGFELDLVGVNTGDYNKFEKITSGKVNAEQVVYISYTLTEFGETTKKTTKSGVRVDLSSDSVDEIFGNNFKEKLCTLNVGDKIDYNTKIGDVSVSYNNLTVDFVTECESNPIMVECYFPYDYSKADLRNEDAVFEVYVEKVKVYNTPEFNDEYLKKKIEDGDVTFTLDDLNEFEGATLVEKYRAYAENLMQDIYETQYDAYVESAIWSHYAKVAKAKKYPKIKVDEMYNSYVSELQDQFAANNGAIYDSTTGQYKTYETVEAYATAYFGLSSDQSWQDYIYSMAEQFVLERLVLYYIIRTENLVPTKDELNAEIEEIKKEYLDEYIAQYLEYNGKTEADYTEEEYKKFTEERAQEIFGYYDEAHFVERAYYSIAAKTMIKWPTVITLDEGSARPSDK